MKTVTIILLAIAIFLPMTISAGLQLEERSFDFGHVGIAFNIFHDFKLFNDGAKPNRVDSFKVSCDCSVAKMVDSIAGPGETIEFKLKFDTKNFYGPTNKSLKVFTNDPALRQHVFYYQAFIGQWINGLRPSHEALFFLPGNKSITLKIKNDIFENVRLSSTIAYDSSFTVKINTDHAKKGSAIELEIGPSPNLSTGTHESCLTIELYIKDNLKPVRMTIPVKSVIY